MYDIIIVGAGPAGMTAAVYGARGGKKILLLDNNGCGGQIITTPEIENYPGIKKISGLEFAQNLCEQVEVSGAEKRLEKVLKINEGSEYKLVITESGEYKGKTVILATGAKNRPLGIDREKSLVGAGVSYCATCDGPFFKNREVAVVGGGNTAIEDAEVLSGYCKQVYLIHRKSELGGEAAVVERLKKKENVKFVMNSRVKEIKGDFAVEAIIVENNNNGELNEIKINGLFVAIGQMPDNEAFKELVNLDTSGYIIASEDCITKTPGIFTAGDCRTKAIRQLTTAASDGATSALAALDFISNN